MRSEVAIVGCYKSVADSWNRKIAEVAGYLFSVFRDVRVVDQK